LTAKYLDLLDSETRARGISLISKGVNEYAWDRQDALSVVAAATNAGLPILGGDVWQQDVSERWRPTHQNWYSERRPNESPADYVSRSRAEALAFLNRHAEPAGQTIRYVVVVGKKE
jgi:Immunity protein 40